VPTGQGGHGFHPHPLPGRARYHGLEHLRQIEQRVDQQGLLAVRNQTGITPAPRSRQAANKRSSRVRDRAVPWCIAICSCKVRNAALSAFNRLVYCSRLGAGCVAGPGVVTPKKGPNPRCPGRPHEPTSPSSALDRGARCLVARAGEDLATPSRPADRHDGNHARCHKIL